MFEFAGELVDVDVPVTGLVRTWVRGRSVLGVKNFELSCHLQEQNMLWLSRKYLGLLAAQLGLIFKDIAAHETLRNHCDETEEIRAA